MKRQLFKLFRFWGFLNTPQPQALMERTLFQKGLISNELRTPTGKKPLQVAFERTPDGQGWITQVKEGRNLIGRLPEADTRIIRKHWNSGHGLRISVTNVQESGFPWDRVRIKIERT